MIISEITNISYHHSKTTLFETQGTNCVGKPRKDKTTAFPVKLSMIKSHKIRLKDSTHNISQINKLHKTRQGVIPWRGEVTSTSPSAMILSIRLNMINKTSIYFKVHEHNNVDRR